MPEEQHLSKVPYETVKLIELDVDASSVPQKKRTPWDKLGRYNISILILGTIAILLAIAFLTFLWAVSINGTTSGNLPPLWKLITERRWTARVITLCSILIRVATAAQLCVFAAIVAALILERVGASAQDFPLLSMIRCANTGPQALIWNVLHTMKTGSQIGYSLLIVVTILNAFALQFTSTILLTDLGLQYVVLNHATVKDIYFGFSTDGKNKNNTNTYAGVDFWYVKDRFSLAKAMS